MAGFRFRLNKLRRGRTSPRFVGTVSPPISTLSDDFNDGTIDTAKWTVVQGTAAESGGHLRTLLQTTYTFVVASSSYDLRNGSVTVEAFPLTSEDGDDTYLGLEGSSPTILIEVWNDTGTVSLWCQIGATTSEIAYNATSHRWWRMREASGTLYLETSPDRSAWTVQVSSPTVSVSAVKPRFAGGSWYTDWANRYSEFDNLNVAAARTAQLSVKASGSFTHKPTYVKISGTFVEKPLKVKVGGSFIDAN
jgi:hypothetical protein